MIYLSVLESDWDLELTASGLYADDSGPNSGACSLRQACQIRKCSSLPLEDAPF